MASYSWRNRRANRAGSESGFAFVPKYLWEIFGQLFSFSTLLVFIISGMALLGLAHNHAAEPRRVVEVAGLVFTVAGAIAALILPAAELGGHYVSSRLEEYSGHLLP